MCSPLINKLIAALCLFPFISLAQGEANNWFWGNLNGMTFNNGTPEPLYCGYSIGSSASTVASDSLGNLLFYCDGKNVLTRTHKIMENGNNLFGEGIQSCIAFKKPGSSKFYYLFTVDRNSEPDIGYVTKGQRYSLIDIEANGGEGKVVLKNVPVQGCEEAMDVITSTFHKNNKDVWVISRMQNLDYFRYLAVLVTENGISQPFILYTIYKTGSPSILDQAGYIRISGDGQKFIDGINLWGFFGRFNNETAELIKIADLFKWPSPLVSNCFGVEFSPSSKHLYLSGERNHNNIIYQLETNTFDSSVFMNSYEIIIEKPYNSTEWYGNLQSAPDGKIYGVQNKLTYLNVINNPDQRGVNCNFQEAGFIANNQGFLRLPQFHTSYIQRFYYSGTCAGSTFTFTSNFFPVPDSIHWDFGDGNTSNMLNPEHIFTHAGNFDVTVKVKFPDGRYGEASRVITVAGIPAPNLGPDVTVCKGTSVALDPGSFVSYTWSNGATGQNIPVADTGLYWVEVVNDTGCINRDTIRVNWFPSPVLDESLLNIAPTTCGDSTGAITGLAVSGIPPVSLSWKNSSGALLGTSPDLYHLPIDNYTLWVTDGAGCSTPVKTYTIRNVGDTLILSVDKSHSHCSLGNGSVTVHATAGLTAMLHYSLNGTDWFTNGGTFTGVAPGSYNVWVRDSLGCMKVYDGNPVVVSSIPGPAVQPPVVVPETGGQSNGSIIITATSAGDTLWYSLNGSAPQLNNGTFQNLATGNYSITITDEYGCDTTLMVTLSNLPLIHLQAIAGDGTACLGNIAVIPLTANNFTGVQSFQAVVYYDPTIVTCQNYVNPHNLLRDSVRVDVIPALGQVNIAWKGSQPVTLANGSSLLELAFAGVIPGNSQIVWDAYPGRCVFVDSIGSNIPAGLTPGQVKVFSIPKADVNDPKAVCEGSDLLIMPMYQTGTGNGNITWNWTGPNGFSSDKQLVYFPVTTAEQSGIYTLTLTDTNQCISIYHINATITPTPKATFHGQDTLYLEPGSTLDAGNGFDSYRWNTGDSTQRIITGSEGWYSVTLKAGKCAATDSVYITTPYAPLYLPTAFTPNGDGLNDVFRPVTNPDQISGYSLQIYDKWGGLIFESKSPQVGWDGRCRKELCPVGVYTYVLRYGSRSAAFSKKERVIRGMVTVVR